MDREEKCLDFLVASDAEGNDAFIIFHRKNLTKVEILDSLKYNGALFDKIINYWSYVT